MVIFIFSITYSRILPVWPDFVFCSAFINDTQKRICNKTKHLSNFLNGIALPMGITGTGLKTKRPNCSTWVLQRHGCPRLTKEQEGQRQKDTMCMIFMTWASLIRKVPWV